MSNIIPFAARPQAGQDIPHLVPKTARVRADRLYAATSAALRAQPDGARGAAAGIATPQARLQHLHDLARSAMGRDPDTTMLIDGESFARLLAHAPRLSARTPVGPISAP